jgi:nucleotidyltransferase substrate binding protein (TIGR01987 family)
MNYDFSTLESAYHQLSTALQQDPANDLERDGVIKRFEYCVELSWKTIRSILLKAGRSEVSASPRPLVREAIKEGLIDSFEEWNEFIEARNESSHTYQQKTANHVFEVSRRFPDASEKLLSRLKEFAARNFL